MSEKNLARVMSGRMLSYSVTKDIHGESFEIRFYLLRLKDKNCFRVIHEEYLSKYQDAGDLYDIDKKIDVKNMEEAIKYLEANGVSISEMR